MVKYLKKMSLYSFALSVLVLSVSSVLDNIFLLNSIRHKDGLAIGWIAHLFEPILANKSAFVIFYMVFSFFTYLICSAFFSIYKIFLNYRENQELQIVSLVKVLAVFGVLLAVYQVLIEHKTVSECYDSDACRSFAHPNVIALFWTSLPLYLMASLYERKKSEMGASNAAN